MKPACRGSFISFVPLLHNGKIQITRWLTSPLEYYTLEGLVSWFELFCTRMLQTKDIQVFDPHNSNTVHTVHLFIGSRRHASLFGITKMPSPLYIGSIQPKTGNYVFLKERCVMYVFSSSFVATMPLHLKVVWSYSTFVFSFSISPLFANGKSTKDSDLNRWCEGVFLKTY